MPNCPHCHEYLEYLNYHRTIIEDGRTWDHAHIPTKEDIEHEEYMCPHCSAHIADTSEDAQKFLRSD